MSDNEDEINENQPVELCYDIINDRSLSDSSTLLEMLKKKEYNRFKSTIGLSEALADTDDLTVIVSNSDSIMGKKNLNKMLNNFLCCLAAESLDSETVNTYDRTIKLASFTHWIQ
jgi:hypothetical protein